MAKLKKNTYESMARYRDREFEVRPFKREFVCEDIEKDKAVIAYTYTVHNSYYSEPSVVFRIKYK